MCAMNPRLLRPTASGFNPKSIAGLEAWYAADVASSITIATGVQQWSDLSGKGRHLIQNTTNNQPLHNSVTLNGKPTVTFDGTNDSLRTASFTLNQPHSYFFAFRFESAAIGGRVLDAGTQGIARAGEFIRIDVNNIWLFAGSILGFNTFPAGAMEIFNIWDAEFNGASSVVRYRKNVASSTGNAGSNNASRLTMGANGNTTAGEFGHVSVAEALVFSRVLAVTEADKIRSYLGKKYNLAYQA
jgi:hypothetical protein